MEGRVYVCSWKKAGKRFRVWVKSRPKLAAEGDTFVEADEALWSVIIDATGDGENQREYAPPAPVASELKEFLKPALVVLAGDTIDRAVGDSQYDGATCVTCGYRAGSRTAEPLVVADMDSGYEGNMVKISWRPFASVMRHTFSEEFLALLRPAERKRFTWRKIERPGRAKKVYYELLAASVVVPQTGVTGLPQQGGWRCETCGHSVFPQYVGYDWPLYWICATDLPGPLPTCFGVSHENSLALCMTAKRWRDLVGKRGTRGILSHDVGVMPPDRCDRAPKLKSVAELTAKTARLPIGFE